MARDPSFVEYVDARWTVLFRLAVLLAGEQRADEVARDALVRAYLAWPPRIEEQPPDEEIKTNLARLALEGDGAPTGGTSPLDVLTPRQRVVAGLRWFEYLSVTDIARALGCTRDTVDATIGEALAGLGVAEGEVASVLARAAEVVVVPSPPREALLARCHEARRRRTRRSSRLLVLAAAVVLAALGAATTSEHRHRPRPASVAIPRALADLPAGEGTRMPYAELSVLHVAGTTVQLEADPLAIVPAGRWIYVSYSNGTIVRLDQEGMVVSPVTTRAAGPPVVDPTGRYVAWVRTGSQPLVVVDTTDAPGNGTRRRERAFLSGGDPPVVTGVSESGDVVLSIPAEGSTWLWHAFAGDTRAGARFHDVPGIGIGEPYQLLPGKKLVVQYRPDRFAVGSIGDDSFTAEGYLVATIADFTDPRGRRIVYVGGAGEVHVRRRTPGFGRDQSHDLRLRLPRLRGGTSGIAWEDDDHVLLEVADSSMPLGALARCDVRTGGCEIAVGFADAPHRLAH
jgi:DNA-directed RNA polymerase specialized sigma24 family protein